MPSHLDSYPHKPILQDSERWGHPPSHTTWTQWLNPGLSGSTATPLLNGVGYLRSESEALGRQVRSSQGRIRSPAAPGTLQYPTTLKVRFLGGGSPRPQLLPGWLGTSSGHSSPTSQAVRTVRQASSLLLDECYLGRQLWGQGLIQIQGATEAWGEAGSTLHSLISDRTIPGQWSQTIVHEGVTCLLGSILSNSE